MATLARSPCAVGISAAFVIAEKCKELVGSARNQLRCPAPERNGFLSTTYSCVDVLLGINIIDREYGFICYY